MKVNLKNIPVETLQYKIENLLLVELLLQAVAQVQHIWRDGNLKNEGFEFEFE